ncbi:MAG: Type 1 glutamine amidotransferase-like domain-containing protein [Acidimicrobiales bacterium]|jgi:peptidase E
MREPQILATSGGMAMTERGPFQWRFGGLLRYALELSGASRPKLCFLGTATGDNDLGIRACYGAAIGENVEPSHLALFAMPNVPDVRQHVLAQDVIWVGGGSVSNLLAVWRVHGLDEIFREAWEAGVVLGGSSAGSICWHVGGTTDSFGPELRVINNGLAFLPYGNGVHYDSNAGRRPLMHQVVASGELPRSYATDDGTGLHYVGTEMREAVTELPGRSVWRVDPDGNGGATEVALPTRLLDY